MIHFCIMFLQIYINRDRYMIGSEILAQDLCLPDPILNRVRNQNMINPPSDISRS